MKLKSLRQRGQGTIEYIGIAVVAAIVIAGLIATPLAPKMAETIDKAICTVFSAAPWNEATCGEAPEDKVVCEVSTHQYGRVADVSADVKAVNGSLRKGATVQLVETNDGWEVVVTSDYGASAGKGLGDGKGGDKGDGKGDGKDGGVEIKPEVDAEAQVNADYSYSKKYTFDKDDEEGARQAFDAAKKNVDQGDALNPFKPTQPFDGLENPSQDMHKIRIEGEAKADVDVSISNGGKDSSPDGGKDSSPDGGKDSSPDGGKDSTDSDSEPDEGGKKILESLKAGLNGSATLGAEGAYATNHDDGTKTVYVQVDGGLEGNANQEFLGTAGANAHGATLLAVTYDEKTNDIVNVTSRTAYNADAGVNGAEDIVNQSVVTASINTDTPEKRKQALEAIKNLDNPMNRYHNGGKDENPSKYTMSDLFYDHGELTKQERRITSEEAEQDMDVFREAVNLFTDAVAGQEVFGQTQSTTDTSTTSFQVMDDNGNWVDMPECVGGQ
ncbi:hypothetical protein [Brevibacterium paucivorans]|uniref:hypothetical protein n=1 Tax=Brevibacterium paucivorans TaxID=170994 RepID=UPI00321B7E31